MEWTSCVVDSDEYLFAKYLKQFYHRFFVNQVGGESIANGVIEAFE